MSKSFSEFRIAMQIAIRNQKIINAPIKIYMVQRQRTEITIKCRWSLDEHHAEIHEYMYL